MARMIVLLVLLFLCGGQSLSFDPDDYLEVYPDPRDPEVLKGRTPLYFALIQSLGGPLSQFDGSGSVAGVKVALDRINNDSGLLPGYTLHYTFADSKCNRTEGINSFFSQILREPRKIAVVGSGCSVATEPTAEISHYFNITQISCVSSSTELRNRLRFPSYFQLLSTEETLAFAYYGVIKEYRWRRVALIVQDENLFTVTIDRLKGLLDRDGVTYDTKLFDTATGISENPFAEGYRIFLPAMYAVNARPLLCKAYELGIRLPRYLLLTPGWYARFWWRIEDEGLNCTVQERESVLFSSLAFLHFVFLDPQADANLNTTTGITGGEYLAEERMFLGEPPLNLTLLEYSQYCYDATWTLAYALNRTLDSLSNTSLSADLAQAYNVTPPFRLEDFTYDSNRLLKVIFQHLGETSFSGVTGDVSFGNQGIRNFNKLIIFQFRNKTNTTDGRIFLDWVEIGNVVSSPTNEDDYDFIYDPGESNMTVWKGLVPYDGTIEVEFVSIHPAITSIYFILACLGIAFAIACLVFNFIFRNAKLMKLASTKLNYLIGIGAIILYFDIIFHILPSTNPDVVAVFCNLTPWLTAIGYSLCYGTILVKMARVYYIFNNPSANKKNVKDWMLLLSVALLVAIDVTIITLYLLVEGVRQNLVAKTIPHQERPSTTEGELGIVTEFFVHICDSTAQNVFIGVLYGYKMALQIVALILAFSIRKVKVKGLDDAKYIGGAIYVTSIVLAVVIVASYTLKEVINGFAALFCTGFLAGTTVILALVFVPLMVGLYKDPKGEDIFKKSANSGPNGALNASTAFNASTTLNATEVTELRNLRRKVQVLESELKERSLSDAKHIAVNEDPKLRSQSIQHALEGSHMVEHDVDRERTFSGTIWDSPDQLEHEKEKYLQNGNQTH